MTPFNNSQVKEVFDMQPDLFRRAMLEVREMMFEVAKDSPEIGSLEEALRWGQPSYITSETKSGSTVRIDRFDTHNFAVFFHCKTMLIEQFRTMFKDVFIFSKNRALVFNPKNKLPKEELFMCIDIAFKYNLNKSRSIFRGDIL